MLETSQNENDEPDLITIAELTRQSRSIAVAFRALEVGRTRQVRARRSGQLHSVAEAVVGDSTAIITLILWDSDIDEIEVLFLDFSKTDFRTASNPYDTYRCWNNSGLVEKSDCIGLYSFTSTDKVILL